MTSHADLPAYHAELADAAALVADDVPTTDKGTVRLVVILLGVLAVIAVVGVVLLAYQTKAIPDSLIAIGSATIGALGALLAKTSS